MKEVTYEEWLKNPTPREMWVWDNGGEGAEEQRKVIYIADPALTKHPVITLLDDGYSIIRWAHCAEIEEPKTRRMTNQELYRWLLDGIRKGKRRELTYPVFAFIHSLTKEYSEDEANSPVDDDILIRENGGEWGEPLVEVEDD